MDLVEVNCAAKKCTSYFSVSNPEKEHFCSLFCAGINKMPQIVLNDGNIRPRKKPGRPKLPPKPPKPKKVIVKPCPKEMEQRRIDFAEIKKKGSHTNESLGKLLGIDPATVSCYLTGKYRITDKKQELIESIRGRGVL